MADDARRSVGVRVRPNSHDFVRDVRADLAKKRATFWVDVRAKTVLATGDVRKWAATDLKRIVPFLDIRANTGPASRDMAEWRRRQAGIDTTVKVKADTSQAIRQIEALRAMARDITVKVHADTSRAADRAVKTAKATADNGKLDISGDNRRNARIAKSLGDYVRAENIGGELTKSITDSLNKSLKSKKIKVDADTTPARKSMYDLLAQFNTEDAKVEIEAEVQTTKARATTEEFRRSQELKNVKLQADIDLRKARTALADLRLKEKLNKIEIDLKVKKGSTDKVSDTLRDVEKRFGNLTVLRSLDLGPLTLGKPTGLIGTLTTVTALAGALPGAVTGLAALSNALVRMSGAAALAPGAIGALAASLATLTIGTSGVGDAFSAMFDMWTEGASKTNQYRNSVQEETKAQRNVANARRDALGELRDLNNELKDGVLNEAQSLLDLQKAKDRYAQGGFDNQTDRLQAELDIAKAEQNVNETRESNLKTQQKATEANAKGVEGSDKVQDALASLAQAQNNSATAQDKFNDAVAQLSPNAQEFVKTIAGMKGQLFDFRNSLQDRIFSGAGSAFTSMFDKLAPTVEPGMQRVADALNKNLLMVFDTIKSPDGISIIDRILGGTADTQNAITNLINPLIKGIGTLVAAGTEHLPQVINLFSQLTTRFTNFITEADRDGSLDKFLNDGVDAMSNLADVGINVIKIINDLSKAFGGDLIKSLADATQKLHEYLSSTEGQAKLNELFAKAKKIWEDWKPTLEKLPGIFESMSDAASGLLDAFGPFLSAMTEFLKNNPGLVSAFIQGWLGAKVISGVLSPIITLFTTATTLAKGLFSLLGKIPGATKLLEKLPGMKKLLDLDKDVPDAGPGNAIKSTLGKAAAFASAPTAIALAGIPLIELGTHVANNQPGQGDIDAINSGLPEGAKPVAGFNRDLSTLNALKSLADKGDPEAKWIMQAAGPAALAAPGTLGADFIFPDAAAETEVAKRYAWAMAHPEITADNFKAPPVGSYMSGGPHTGYTPWGAKQGKMAELHGGEYVEPKDVVDHYGLDAMRAVHQKRAVISSFETGGSVDPGAGWWGGQRTPNGNWIQPGNFNPNMRIDASTTTTTRPLVDTRGRRLTFGDYATTVEDPGNTRDWNTQRPQGLPSPIPGFAGGGPNMVYDPATGQYVDGGTGGTSISHGLQGSAAPGPGIIDTLANGGAGIFSAFGNQAAGGGPFGSGFMGSLGIPGLTPPNGTQGPGWAGGSPPIGLGGGPAGPNGEAPFDIRSLGIGPGPVGSGPNDWAQFAGSTLGKFGSSFITTLAGGLLDSVGLSGVSSYVQSGSGLANHFLGDPSKAQGPGAGQTNADVSALLATAGGMAGNPAYPGIPGLPGVFDPSTGSAVDPTAAGNGGLQVNTMRGKAAIAAAFPWATNIGGVRADALKWHPEGLALDVMIPGEKGNNDPTSPKGLAMGNQLYAWLMANKAALGIDYLMWQQKDHFNHIHVNFAASGYPPGGGQADVGAPGGLTAPGSGGWTPSSGSATASPGSPGWNIKMPPPKPTTNVKPNPFDPKPLPVLTRDRGGPLPVGTSIVRNFTGKPETVLNHQQAQYVGSFLPGGYIPQGVIMPPKPVPDIKPITRPITPTPKPTPPPTMSPPPVIPTMPPMNPIAGGSAPGAAPTAPSAPPGQGPINMPIAASDRPTPGPGDTGDHVHPALRKGITSGFAAAGNIAGAAASMGMMGMGGGAGGGGVGALVSGLFTQAGKIANNVANVASSFLVGNITGGTTANPYGVTQRGSVPTGGTKMVDASNNQFGDIYTNDLDSYFARVDRRDSQRAQSGLGRWGNE